MAESPPPSSNGRLGRGIVPRNLRLHEDIRTDTRLRSFGCPVPLTILCFGLPG